MPRKYEEVKTDYYRLVVLCNGNTVKDYCGAWCGNDVMDELLDNPSKKTAARLFSSLISRMHSHGIESDEDHNSNWGDKLNLMDSEIHEILVRNGDL